MVPQTGSGPATEDRFAHGNGDLLLRMARDLEAFGAPTLVVSSADHVFAADLDPIIEDHLASGLAATVVTSEVAKKEAAQNVTVESGADGRVTRVEEKPSRPTTGTVATELFVYQVEPLLETLRTLRSELSGDAEGDDSGIGDFAEHLLPRLVQQRQVRAVPLAGYWRDLGRPDAYLQGHRDLLAGRVDVFEHPDRPVISKWQDRTAARARAGAVVEDSMLSPGCDVSGTVIDSVLGPGVVVEAGAHIEDCVIFADVRIERGARVSTSIIDERCVIGRDAVVGAMSSNRVARDEEIVLMGRDSQVGLDVGVAAGSRLEPGTTA
jgi:glucose-1-phosphate adenylyltransferase